MKKLATVALVAFALTGCGTHLAPGATLAPAALAAAAHKKSTPDNVALSPKEITAGKAAVEKALNKRMIDNTVTVTDEKFTRTAVPGLLQFTATQTTIGFAGFPIKMAISGDVNLNTGEVTVLDQDTTKK